MAESKALKYPALRCPWARDRYVFPDRAMLKRMLKAGLKDGLAGTIERRFEAGLAGRLEYRPW